MTEFIDSKTYEIQQQDETGVVLASQSVEATSGDSAAKQLQEVLDQTQRIVVCLDGSPVNEMGIDFWLKRMRRR